MTFTFEDNYIFEIRKGKMQCEIWSTDLVAKRDLIRYEPKLIDQHIPCGMTAESFKRTMDFILSGLTISESNSNYLYLVPPFQDVTAQPYPDPNTNCTVLSFNKEKIAFECIKQWPDDQVERAKYLIIAERVQ